MNVVPTRETVLPEENVPLFTTARFVIPVRLLALNDPPELIVIEAFAVVLIEDATKVVVNVLLMTYFAPFWIEIFWYVSEAIVGVTPAFVPLLLLNKRSPFVALALFVKIVPAPPAPYPPVAEPP